MAVGFSVAEKTLEDLEKEVTCAVCQEHYTEPKILPCLHSYCKECILRLALRTGKDKPFSCPECRKDTTLPEGGVEELKSAFLINRLKSMYFKHKKALSKQVQCEMCKSEPPAEAFCKQCDKFACKNCAQMHTEMVVFFEGHEIFPIDKLHEVKTEELVPKNPAPKKKCQIHGKTLKIFCFDCSKPICRDCTVKDHKDHNIEFNNVAAGDKKKDLTESLKPLRKVEDSLYKALDKVRNTEREVEGQGDSVANTIETSFEKLHTILDTRKQQLLEETRRIVKEKIENLKGQEKNLSIGSAGVRSIIDYTEQCVRHGSDEEVMSMHTEISRRIQEEVEGHSKPGNSLEPVEEADIGVEASCAEDLQQLCQKVKVYSMFAKKKKSSMGKSHDNEEKSFSRPSRSRPPPPSRMTKLVVNEPVVYSTVKSPRDDQPTYPDPRSIQREEVPTGGDIYTIVEKKKKNKPKKSRDEVPMYSVVDKCNHSKGDNAPPEEELVYRRPPVQSLYHRYAPSPSGVTQQDANEPVVYSTVDSAQQRQ